jgi:predicted amidohydrolase
VDGPTRAALAHLAKRFDCLVVGPLIERAESGLANSLLGITPEGATLLHYRKHHPWFPEKWATPGPSAGAVVSWRGTAIVPAICFDVHFLSEDAGAQLNAADLLLFASAWVDDDEPADSDSRPPLLQDIAARHAVAVLNANWGPGRPRVHGQGGSLFVDAKGHLEARLKTDTGRLDVTLP